MTTNGTVAPVVLNLSAADLAALGVSPAATPIKASRGASDVVLVCLFWGQANLNSTKDAVIAKCRKATPSKPHTDAEAIVAKQTGGTERWLYVEHIKGYVTLPNGRTLLAAPASYFAAKDMTDAKGALIDDGGAKALLDGLKASNPAQYAALLAALGMPQEAPQETPKTPETSKGK